MQCPVSVQARTQDIPWRKYNNSTKLVIRITALSTQALLEIVQDMEVLVSRPLPLLKNTGLRPSMIQRGYKAVIKCPHSPTEEEVYQISFPNDQIVHAAMNAMRPYFNITSNVPLNNAGTKRPRPQSQSQGLVRRVPPPIQHPVPQMYDFGHPNVGPPIQPYHNPQVPPIYHPYPAYPPASDYAGLPTPSPSTGRVIIPPSMPITHTSPIAPARTSPPVPPRGNVNVLPIPPTPADPIRESSPPPAEDSEDHLPAETQFLETQYSLPKGSSSSSCDKPSNAQVQKSSSQLESDETLEDIPKRESSTAVEVDLLSMDDDEINHSPGLAAHPAMDPYEGMPWSSNRQNCQDRNTVRPNRYIDAGVYSMTEDQLDDIISEIVIETGFQGMCERIWRVMDARFNEGNREETYDEDAF